MIRCTLSTLLLLVTFISSQAQDKLLLEETARRFFNHLMNKEIDEMNQMFTPEFLEKVPPGQIGQIAEGLENQLGKFSHIQRTVHLESPPFNIVTLVVRFGQMDWGMSVTFDQNLMIAGFHINLAPPEKYTPSPTYANTTLFTEKELILAVDTIELPAVLTLPNQDLPAPLVILVHGSGPHDMDETIGPNKIFRDIAQGLASCGIAVLRYEKRTFRYAETLNTETFTVWDEAGRDAAEIINKAGDFEGIDPTRIYLAGHSLGGMIAPRIGQQATNLAGIISLAGSPRYLSDIIPGQYRHLAMIRGDESEVMQNAIHEADAFAFEMKEKRNDPNAVYEKTMLNLPVSYWKDLNQSNTSEIAGTLPLRFLIIQGGRDYQVSTIEFDAWKEALNEHPDATFLLFEDLDHLFFSGEGLSNPTSYFEENNVDARIIEAISNWINN